MERQSSVKTVIHGSCVRQKDGVPTASRCCHEHAPIFRDKTKSSILETGVTVLGKLAAKAPEAFLEQYPGLMTPHKLLYLASIRGALSPLAKHAR